MGRRRQTVVGSLMVASVMLLSSAPVHGQRLGPSAGTRAVAIGDRGPTALYFLGERGAFSAGDKISVINANPFTATVTVTYFVRGHRPVVQTDAYPPGARARMEVAEQEFSGIGDVYAVEVSSPARLIAEHIRGYARSLHVPSASPNLSRVLYFAEGYTGGRAKEYLTLANPGRSAAHIVVMAAPQASSAADAPTERLTLRPGDAVTRDLGRDFGRRGTRSFGLIISGDRPVLAERVLRFDDSPAFPSQEDRSDVSTAATGIERAATTLLFPYGSAAGPSFIAVLNPGRRPAAVRAHFSDSLGRTVGSAALTVAPGARGTMDLGAVGRATAVYATVLTATVPIVAEESQYFGGSLSTGVRPGVALAGATAAITRVVFPDLDLRNPSITFHLGQPKRQTVYLYNPTTTPITVTATYHADARSFTAGYANTVRKIVAYAVAADGITTVDVNADASSIVTYPLGNGTLESTLDAAFVATGGGWGAQFVAAALTAPAAP